MTEGQVLRPNSLGGLPIRSSATPTWINAVIYGHPGVGKTVFAGSASLVEEMSPVLILDTEQGTMSLTGHYDGIDIITMKTYEDYANVHNALRAGKMPYKTIIIDSITEMAMMGLEEIVSRSVQDAKARGKEHDPEQPELQDWGRNMTRVNKLIRFFKSLPCHVFFIALEYTDTSRAGKPMAMPSLNTKRLSGELPGAVDGVYWLFKKEDPETKEIYRVLLTDAIPQAMAKDRSRTLPLTMRNPTMQDLYDYYTGAKTKDSENNG